MWSREGEPGREAARTGIPELPSPGCVPGNLPVPVCEMSVWQGAWPGPRLAGWSPQGLHVVLSLCPRLG